MSNLRRRNFVLGFALILFLPVCLFMLFSVPDMTTEEVLFQRVAELEVKLQYLDTLYRSRLEDLQQLNQHLEQICPQAAINTTSSSDHLLMLLNAYSIQQAAQQRYPSFPGLSSSAPTTEQYFLLRNISSNSTNAQSAATASSRTLYLSGLHANSTQVLLRMPTFYSFLPHLLDADPREALRPAYLLSKGRTAVSMVMGVPTVRREKSNYLLDTLQNLLDGMLPNEMNDTLIVVFVAETDLDYVLQTARDIEMRFRQHVESGLIEVLSPSASYYPDFKKLRITLRDSKERVHWRSKQNLDYAYLMSYCQLKGTFYLQLEDDILTKSNYSTKIKQFTIEKIKRKEPWLLLDFCQLGFIGKLFKTSDIPFLVQFFIMFYNEKPVDWLLQDLLAAKVCGMNCIKCQKEKAKLWLHHKPSLFQHIGTHSSLKGKVQSLKDKQFGKLPQFYPHSNPEAKVASVYMKHYRDHSLERAYAGDTFFWGINATAGAKLEFNFTTPIPIIRYLFRSGNMDHPNDTLLNATVEVLTTSVANRTVQNSSAHTSTTDDNYVIVGKFNAAGIAQGSPNESIGLVNALRLLLHSNSNNWILLSEIYIQSELANR